jgi:hypothetical protein
MPNTDADKDQKENSKQSFSDHAIVAVANIERTAYEARSHMDQFADTITRPAGSGISCIGVYS